MPLGCVLQLVALLLLNASDVAELLGRGRAGYFRLKSGGAWRVTSHMVIVVSLIDTLRLLLWHVGAVDLI